MVIILLVLRVATEVIRWQSNPLVEIREVMALRVLRISLLSPDEVVLARIGRGRQ